MTSELTLQIRHKLQKQFGATAYAFSHEKLMACVAFGLQEKVKGGDLERVAKAVHYGYTLICEKIGETLNISDNITDEDRLIARTLLRS
jgi:hypothetical protein